MNLARLWMSRASPRHNHKFNSGAVHEGGTFWTHWWLLFSGSDKRTNEQTDKQTASPGKPKLCGGGLVNTLKLFKTTTKTEFKV